MDDPILALIDRRLQSAAPANVTDEQRLAASVTISAAASNGNAEAKATMAALRASFPDLFKAMAIATFYAEPEPPHGAERGVARSNGAANGLDQRDVNPHHDGQPWRAEIMRLHLAITGERIFAGKSKVTKVNLDDGQPQIEACADH